MNGKEHEATFYSACIGLYLGCIWPIRFQVNITGFTRGARGVHEEHGRGRVSGWLAASRLCFFLVGYRFPLKYIEYGVYGDPIITYPKPYSIYLRGTISP